MMMIWTQAATEVLRDATAKADAMNHREVHPLHLMWALVGRIGMDALRHRRNDQAQAKLMFRVERDLGKLPEMPIKDGKAWGECSSPGPRLQNLLLRAAELSHRQVGDPERGRIGLEELMQALLQDDPRTAVLLRARERMLAASA